MTQRRQNHTPVHARRQRVLVVAIAILGVAPQVVAAAGPTPPRASSPETATLAITRIAHATHLRFAGAHITRDRRLHLQQAYNDCALAVVEQLHAMRQWPRPDRQWLADALALGPMGVTLDRLAETLRQLGWAANVVRTAPDGAVRSLPLPAITLMRPGHFVLLTGRTRSQVEYFDPLVGLVRQPLPAFEARWTGKSVQLSARDN